MSRAVLLVATDDETLVVATMALNSIGIDVVPIPWPLEQPGTDESSVGNTDRPSLATLFARAHAAESKRGVGLQGLMFRAEDQPI